MTVRTTRRRALIAAGLAAAATAAPSTASAEPNGTKPTVVLVHGAFTDAASWHGVIGALRRSGYQAIAPANPLRDLAGDASYLASVIASIAGPVVLVGHSYGGAVITNAARSAPNVTALVYVAAFAPDTGESLAGLSERFPKTPLADAVRPQPFPLPDGSSGADLYIDRAAFPAVFAQDIPAHTGALLAATQRPISAAAFTAPSSTPAWKSLPSWYQISRHDRALHPDAQHFFANRMAAKTIELDSSHASPIARPHAIADLIRTAARQA